MTIGASDNIKIRGNARRILIPRRPTQQGADPSSRLGDLTPRKLHYQTGLTGAVNSAKSPIVATINRDKGFAELSESHAKSIDGTDAVGEAPRRPCLGRGCPAMKKI
jgi:hypothetical protein